MSNASDPVLDPAVIDELRRLQSDQGNPAFLTELVSIFKANAPSRMAAAREAIANRDRGALEHIAHTLKSNCGMLGAARMAALCAEFEKAADQEDFARAAALLPEAEAEFSRVLAAVEQLCGQEPSS